MEHEFTMVLIWAIIVTITLGVLAILMVKFRQKQEQDIRYKEDEILELAEKLGLKQSRSFQAGVNMSSGDYAQILGEFALLSKYDHIITLSTTSQQPSLDLIGINEETVDFLEIKKKGGDLTSNENHIKKLIEEKKVSYKIFDVDLPKNFSIKERPQKELVKKESYMSSQKETFQSAYQPWTKADDEFLKKFWNDESNKQNRDELIQELSEKLRRNIGGIKSRLNKMGLD